MIFDQYSIVSRLVNYLSLKDLDNCQLVFDDVVVDCCMSRKSELLRNRWLKFDYLLSQHPNCTESNPYLIRNREKNLVSAYHGLYVYITTNKSTNKLLLNIESVYGTLVQYFYDLPTNFQNCSDNEIYKTIIFTVPKIFSSRNQISHIVRGTIKLSFVYFDIDIQFYLLDEKNYHLKPEMKFYKADDDDVNAQDWDLKFNEIFRDEFLSNFTHLTKTNEKVEFNHIEPIEYSHCAEVFIDEENDDIYYYDDLIKLKNAVVLKFNKNVITNFLKIKRPFDLPISSTKVLGQRFYSLINYQLNHILIYDLDIKFNDPQCLPLFENKGNEIVFVQYVCGDCVALFTKNEEEYKITFVQLFSGRMTLLSQMITNCVNFDNIQVSFTKDVKTDHVFMMFIDKDDHPQFVQIF